MKRFSRKRRQKRRGNNKTLRKGGQTLRKNKLELKKTKVPVHSCNPLNKNKLENSCFTAPILKTLVQVYNQTHTNSPLNFATQSVEQILHQLKSNLCSHKKNQEYCVAKTLNQSQVIQDTFMPERVWKSSNEWLSNEDTDKVMALYDKAYPHFKYCGTMTIDFADKSKQYGCHSKYFCEWQTKYKELLPYTQWGMIFNLDKMSQGGSHWVSLFMDFQEKPPVAFYFDSATTYGSRIPAQIKKLIDMQKRKWPNLQVMNNSKQHQRSNTECGVYSLFFIITMLTRQIPYLHTEPMPKQDIYDLFLHGHVPDSFIEQYRQIFFTVAH